MDDDDDHFTPEELEAIQRENLAFRPTRGPQLTKAGRCQIYACLISHILPDEICEVFGVTRSTVSYIAGCREYKFEPVNMTVGDITKTLNRDPFPRKRQYARKWRYRDVSDEFDRLGETEFLRIYFTKGLAQRCKQARHQLNPDRVFLKGM